MIIYNLQSLIKSVRNTASGWFFDLSAQGIWSLSQVSHWVIMTISPAPVLIDGIPFLRSLDQGKHGLTEVFPVFCQGIFGRVAVSQKRIPGGSGFLFFRSFNTSLRVLGLIPLSLCMMSLNRIFSWWPMMLITRMAHFFAWYWWFLQGDTGRWGCFPFP